MSRTINLAMARDEVEAHCRAKKVDVSALETLPAGGVRLVCSSGAGADKIRSTLKRKLIHGEVERAAFRPTRPLW
jgi:hypothetical protein